MNWYKKANLKNIKKQSQVNPINEQSGYEERGEQRGEQNQQEAAQRNEFEIRADLLPALEKKVNKLQKIAEKLNLPPMQFTVSQPYPKKIEDDRRDTVLEWRKNRGAKNETPQAIVDFVTVTLVGTPPKLANWEFVARIEASPNENQNNLVFTAPGYEGQIPPEYYTANAFQCQHCNTERNRKETFIVRNTETGEFKQVGRNCLVDFLGHGDARNQADWLERWGQVLRDFEEASNQGSSLSQGAKVPEYHDTTELLAITSAVMRGNGGTYISRSKAFDMTGVQSTYSHVNTILNPQILKWSARDEDKNKTIDQLLQGYMKENNIKIEDKDFQRAEKVLNWIRNLDEEKIKNNNYMMNLKTILSGNNIGGNHGAMAASAIAAYDRYMTSQAEKEKRQQEYEKKKQERKKSDFIGEKGQKIIMEAKLVNKNGFNSQYGWTNIYKFADNNGNLYTWFSSKDLFLNEGNQVILFASIKDHNEYKEIKSTIITRGKILFNFDDAEEEMNIKQIQNYIKKADINIGIDLEKLKQKED